MNVHFSYKLPRTPDIDREIQHATEKVQKRLQWFRPELVHLKGSVEQNSTWHLIEPPSGHRPIGLKWVYKVKKDASGGETLRGGAY